MVLVGPNTWFPIMWICKRQTSTSRSTTEAEMVSLATSLFGEAIPALDLWELILGRPVELWIMEDNQATIKIAYKGYSQKLRHCQRVQKINLGSVKEVLEWPNVHLEHCSTDLQAADIFTKELAPLKWANALALLGMDTSLSEKYSMHIVEKKTGGATAGVSAGVFTTVDSSVGETCIVPIESAGGEPTVDSLRDNSSPQEDAKLRESLGAEPLAHGILGACDIIDDIVSEAWSDYIETEIVAMHADAVRDIKLVKGAPLKPKKRSSGKLSGWGKVIEICTGDESNLGTAAEEFEGVDVWRITKATDFELSETQEQIKKHLRLNPGCTIHGSLPCTVWSQWQKMCIHRYGKSYDRKLKVRQRKAAKLLGKFIERAELCLSLGGHVSFEWPRYCKGWLRKELMKFIHQNNLFVADVDGCACGMKNSDGEPLLKQWRFVCSSERQALALGHLRCKHEPSFKHGIIAGSVTKATEEYPLSLCRTWLSSLFGFHNFCPCLPR